MDRLNADGFVVLGGPVGAGDGEEALLVVNAADQAAITATLKNDPWIKAGILKTRTIRRWGRKGEQCRAIRSRPKSVSRPGFAGARSRD